MIHGADINSVQTEGNVKSTALFFACQRNDLASVKGFIALGADPNLQVISRAAKFDKIKTLFSMI